VTKRSPSQIKAEADALLKEEGIEALLLQFGDVVYSGSYSLDLMVWNDIDLYLVPKEGLDWDECAASVSAAIARRKDADSVRVEKSLWRKMAALPEGIYVGVRMRHPRFASMWKLDIWMVDEETRTKNKQLLDAISTKLTPETRELIVKAKAALITPEGRTPSMSSVHVYQAVLDLGMRSVEDVVAYVESLDDAHRKSKRVD
jgi:hypothetical protein